MSKNFRESHLLTILKGFSLNGAPLDVYLRNYFKSNKSLGSHDRKYIAEAVYQMFRWLGFIDYFLDGDYTWEKRVKVYHDLDNKLCKKPLDMPAHIAVSFPKALYDLLKSSLGEQKTNLFCLASNTQAPITVRANTLKTSRDELYDAWVEKFGIQKCCNSQYGITFSKRENFYGFPEFKNGLFEVQDEGSQLIAELMDPKPGQHVLDFCSGSGGKTLAFAHKLKERGQIFLHDIRPHALIEAKKRLKRAGIQNAQILNFDDPKKIKLKSTMDWVLVDGPCSGTGTFRRNPDMKWKFDPSSISRIQNEQREIFAEALEYVKPGGKIVYATCSILPQENQYQNDYFLNHHPLKNISSAFESFPEVGRMDGFYGVVYEKLKS